MATLHKFKLLATQCAVPCSTSPVVRLRRRKTLRMLLRRLPLCRHLPDRKRSGGDSPENGKKLVVRLKLKELFLSSPPFEQRISEKAGDDGEGFFPATGCAGGGGGSIGRRDGRRSFRQQLVRRQWRPVLVTIPE